MGRYVAAVLFVMCAFSAAHAARWEADLGSRKPGVPVVAVVGLQEQRITVYDADGAILKAPISTGQRGYETPAGVFSILQKNKDHASNLYDAQMPFMQRLTWSGVALHAGGLPGYRASHGCVRLPYGFAERLFDLTAVGTRVVVAPKNAPAKAVQHAQLTRLTEAGAAAAAGGNEEAARLEANRLRDRVTALEKRVAKAAADARRAEAAKNAAVKRLSAAVARSQAGSAASGSRGDGALDRLRADAAAKIAAAVTAADASNAASAELDAAKQQANLARLRAWPTSILVSLATKRVYVRQGFEPALELPINIRDPQRSIGTHALYATENGAGERGWMGVSLEGGAVAQALDRIEIPDEAAKLIARGVWPGTMLVVSDEPPHKQETGAGTDFVVVLSDQPQGALKLRTPVQDGAVAGLKPGAGEKIRAYRSVGGDEHFRHPLGSFP